MRKLKSATAMLVGLAACAAGLTIQESAQAQSAQDAQALQEQLKVMQQQMDALQKKVQQVQQEQAQAAQQQQQAAASGPPASAASAANGKEVSTEPKFDKFLKGFYGALDVSIDYTSKGMDGFVAYGNNPVVLPNGQYGGYTINSTPKNGGAGPYGHIGYLAQMSSNGSNIGYRGAHSLGTSGVDFIYQVSTSINMVAAPGLQDTWTKSSNTVQGAIGLGDTYVGFQALPWGKIKFGEMYMPYKTSTDRMNPFAGQLGDYAVIMGNSGGDNRVEFGTRGDHVILYNSPVWAGFSFDAAFQFGQQIDPNSDLPALGSVDCYGGNNPGSGNLFLNCDDGGYSDGYSADLKFEKFGFYLVAAYELHKQVNRSSDGIGANNPYYTYLFNQGPNGPNAALLDWADYQAYAGEYPLAAAAGSPAYSTAYDVADEWAMKFGGQYSFDFGLTISYIYEDMHRDVPQALEFQNERQRIGDWVAVQQTIGKKDTVALGWAHAGASVGDPGGQHNYNPAGIGSNQANMYTAGWWHRIDRQLTVYFDAAETINDGNAHYDIGAGGHGIKTDCHDATHAQFIDYSSAGPTTWGGCHPIGFSTGVNYKF